MRRRNRRKLFLTAAMATVFLIVFCLAVWRPFSASQAIIAGMSARQYGSTGAIFSADGDVLFDGTSACYADTRTLTGELDTITNNTLLQAYLPELTGADQYSAFSGMSSMTEAKSDLYITLQHQTMETVAGLFGNKHGAAFAFNYETGEIYVLYSAPYLALGQTLTTEEENSGNYDGIYLNKCLDGLYIPGSTMKVITTICAAEQMQAGDLWQVGYDCTGTYTSPDGVDVICFGGAAHGSVGIVDALGKSCNGFFSHLAAKFNIPAAQQTLQTLGIASDGKGISVPLDRLNRTGSSTLFQNTDASSTFGMFGQGASQMNLIDMARIAAAAVNGGSITEPYLVSSILRQRTGNAVYTAEPSVSTLISPEAADSVSRIWHDSTARYYPSVTYGTLASCLKTGTAQQGNHTDDKLLLGVSEELHTAFCIVVEDYTLGDPTPAEIAKGMLEALSIQGL